ncbi:hypothetical protein [Streptomyces xantholiticus]|nr:hypothetical protein [Streptomyces xantholiticus]
MLQNIMLSLIPPVEEHPLEAGLCVLVIVILVHVRGRRLGGCNG